MGALDPLPGYPVGGTGLVEPKGIPQPGFEQVVGTMDRRPVSIPGEGIPYREPTPAGVLRAPDKLDYCLPGEAPRHAEVRKSGSPEVR